MNFIEFTEKNVGTSFIPKASIARLNKLDDGTAIVLKNGSTIAAVDNIYDLHQRLETKYPDPEI